MQTKRGRHFLLPPHVEQYMLDWLASLDLDGGHVQQVAFLSVELFCELETLHQEPPRSCHLLHAAALLHDCGYAVDVCKHHKHARDMILRESFPGFSAVDNKAIACLARYHRKAAPSARHRLFRELDADMSRTVERMAALLRIADGLDRSHMSAIRGIRAQILSDCVQLKLVTHYEIGTDLWGGERKKSWFEELFAHRVLFDCVESEALDR